MKLYLVTTFAGFVSFFAQIPPPDTFLPPGTEQLSLTGALVFAIWWLGKQNSQQSKASADRERELKAEYEKRIAKLEKQVNALQRAILNEPTLDLSKTTRRSLIADSTSDEDDV